MPENDGSTFFMGQFIQVSLMKNINYEYWKDLKTYLKCS